MPAAAMPSPVVGPAARAAAILFALLIEALLFALDWRDVQAYANELAKYYNEFRVAEEKGDQARLEELLKQQVSYHQKQQEVLQSQPTEEKEKFRAWAAEVAKAAQE